MGNIRQGSNIIFINSLTSPFSLQGFPEWPTDQQFSPFSSQSSAHGGCMPEATAHSLKLPSQLSQHPLGQTPALSSADIGSPNTGSPLAQLRWSSLQMHLPHPCPHLTALLSSHFPCLFHYFQHSLSCPS